MTNPYRAPEMDPHIPISDLQPREPARIDDDVIRQPDQGNNTLLSAGVGLAVLAILTILVGLGLFYLSAAIA